VEIATAQSAEFTEKSTGEMESKKINLREKGEKEMENLC